MIVKTNAIVLKSVDYSESSIIATLFTRKKGKTAVIAKGARRPKSKFAAFLVPGQLTEVVYYYKQSRSVQTLSDISYSKKLNSLRVEIDKMALMMSTLELTSQLLHENEVNKPLYDFIETFLEWSDKQKEIPKLLFPYIQLRLAEFTGVGLQITEELAQEGEGFINISSGTISNDAADKHSVRLSPMQFVFVKKSLHSANASVLRIVMDEEELKNLIKILDNYFIYHIEGVKPRKSDKIFEQLLKK